METSLLISIINHRLFQTLFVFFILLIMGFVLSIFFTRKIESRHSRRNTRFRVWYMILTIFVIFMCYIWLTGLRAYHIFTVLSFFSAGFLVANKESVMNLLGALIINWRNLFSEGDRIAFNNYTGYVTKIGVLYFTLNETSQYSLSRASGKIVRIPNGLVIVNPIINYSRNLNVFETSFNLVITHDSNISAAQDLLLDTVKETLTFYFEHNREYNAHYTHKRNQFAQILLDSAPSVVINMLYNDPVSVELKACFYAYSKDHQEIKNTLIKAILEKLKSHSDITLGKQSD